ncbi:YjjG family noncanonical pyrimidine nucleotidase [Galbibacter mesophilus]|uniref:YjjG family noncanonical pyrimidine nucleotidase n=1 Tax=Galbibacter mesophilus TaxID=379069 RepID=UPI00191D63FE|nr:YjjG family noncanonical pyrimidine nucleotidase [Galbibacter mesophilus]MCM5661753.1 YjjG family noncanonical pyrimidine nucleotidase [Galbibacter mesophilus]
MKWIHEGITDVFFDLDHTLWDFEKNSKLTYQKIFTDHRLDIDLDTFLEVYVPINFKLWKLYQEDKIAKEELRYERLKSTFDALKLTVDNKLITTLSDDYITHLSTFNHLFSDSIETLEYLAPKYNLHIITNGFAEVQQGKLKNSNIDHYFNVVMNSELAGVKKPNPLIFQKALEMAKVKPENSLMIGDSYEADFLGAQNVGMHALLFTTSDDYKNVNSQVIKELKQIKQYI